MRPLLAALLALACLHAPAHAEDPDTAFQNVVVKPGDTLWSISNQFLKDPSRWDEILKHNRLPSGDPTVALPGMVLRVPVKLIKTNLRAAHLVYAVNQVLFRRKDTPDWKGHKQMMELFQGDGLRTLAESKARVKFLNKEILSLEPNSMAVIKPNEDGDLELKSGSVFAGRARVVTASARVTPRTGDTRYSATVEPDLTTKVEVYKGAAGVAAQGSEVEVKAGFSTKVMPGLAPEVPRVLENMPDLEARAQEFASAAAAGGGAASQVRLAAPPPEPEADAESLRGDIQSLRVGLPIMGYRVQASREKEFGKIIFDKQYDAEDRFVPAAAGLPPGAYWWRIAIIDLLGTEGRYSEPRYYSVGLRRAEKEAGGGNLAEKVSLTSPAEGYTTDRDHVQIIGVLRDDRLKVEVEGRPVRIDADGNFVVRFPLNRGNNSVVISISDAKGNVTRISRRVTRL